MWSLSGPVLYLVVAGASLLAGSFLSLRTRRKQASDGDIRESPIPAIAEAEPNADAIERQWQSMQADYERRHGCKLICIVHEGNEGLDEEQATDIVKTVMSAKGKPIDVVLHTFGGFLMASERVAEALAASRRTTAFVPYYAMSGGTEIALATERIMMGRHAHLGPTDVQFGMFAARDFEELEQEKGVKDLTDTSALLAIRARRVKRDIEKVCGRINRSHKKRIGWGRRSCDLAAKLTDGAMDHSHRITLSEARALAINVVPKMPDDVYALVDRRREQLKLLRKIAPSIRILGAAPHGHSAPAAIP